MRELHMEAEKAGIVVMNEIGLDPGIDHLYAVKTIDEVHEKGGKACHYHFQYLFPHFNSCHRSNNFYLTAAVCLHLNVQGTL
jgi:hypothetical protein